MLNRLCLTILIIIHTATACYGLEVVAVKSSPAQPYDVALQAFSQQLIALSPVRGTKAIKPVITIRGMTLNSEEQPDALRRTISQGKPDLIVALGSKALRVTAPIHDIPIIYLLVPVPDDVVSRQANITGVLLQPEAGAQFRTLKNIMPSAKRVGVIYDPDKTTALIDNAARANKNLVFVRRPARSPQEVASQLSSLEGEIDLLWMVPDSTILSPQTEKSFFRFAHKQKIPILAFSEKYLARGASFAISLNLEEMGRMAARLATQIQKGIAPQHLPPLKTLKVDIKINRTIIDKLGLKLQEGQP